MLTNLDRDALFPVALAQLRADIIVRRQERQTDATYAISSRWLNVATFLGLVALVALALYCLVTPLALVPFLVF